MKPEDFNDSAGPDSIARMGRHHVAVARRDIDSLATAPMNDEPEEGIKAHILALEPGGGWHCVDGSAEVPAVAFTREELKANPVAQALGYPTLHRLAYDMATGYHAQAVDVINEAANNALAAKSEGNGDDYHTALATVLRFMGYVVVCEASNGYTQGDYATVLAWMSPEYAEGYSPEAATQALGAHIETIKAWLWGDVFDVSVYRVDPEAETEDINTCALAPVDSCGPYYGTDHRDSGLFDVALEMVGAARATLAKEVRERRAGWRNLAPHEVRALRRLGLRRNAWARMTEARG